jgi:hypothetical protein
MIVVSGDNTSTFWLDLHHFCLHFEFDFSPEGDGRGCGDILRLICLFHQINQNTHLVASEGFDNKNFKIAAQ